MLHGLERADGLAELLALRGIGDGLGDQAVAHAERLRRAGERAAVERRGEQVVRALALGDARRRARR
jgi:hypothetical protein